ncbi:MAG: hypothetical protein GX362_04355 [Methanosarcinaceae archaeon]|nr:hypothetical protein [Methanosarcinaceae archaeon]
MLRFLNLGINGQAENLKMRRAKTKNGCRVVSAKNEKTKERFFLKKNKTKKQLLLKRE